jgi:hypothetical protein
MFLDRTIMNVVNEKLKARLPLDPSLYTPSEADLQFLRQTVSPDDEEIKERALAIQQE